MSWDQKIIVGLFAAILVGMVVTAANIPMPKKDDYTEGMKFVCETYGGVYVDNNHCYKAENLFKVAKK